MLVGRFFTRAARKVAFRTYFNTKSKAKKQNEHLKKTDRTLVNIQIGFKAVFVHGMMEKRRFQQEKKKKKQPFRAPKDMGGIARLSDVCV